MCRESKRRHATDGGSRDTERERGRDKEVGHRDGGSRKDRKRRRPKSGRGGRRRNERGQYVETVTDEDILAVLSRVPGPVITTTDLAERFDITTEGARRKLNDLCDAGVLDRRKTGQTRVYWRVEADGND